MDLTTQEGIAAACKSAEGQKALLRGDGCKSAEDFVKLALTALPLALAELARVQGEAERYKAVVEWALSCRAENTREWLGNLAALFTKADGERRWVYDPGQDTFRCQPQTAADAAGGE